MEPKVSIEQFIRVWQTCVTVDEVCERLHLPAQYVSVRASNIRKRGIPLKFMYHKGTTIDIEALAKLARELEK